MDGYRSSGDRLWIGWGSVMDRLGTGKGQIRTGYGRIWTDRDGKVSMRSDFGPDSANYSFNDFLRFNIQ